MVPSEKESRATKSSSRSLRGTLRNTGARLTKNGNPKFLAILAISSVALLIAVLGTPLVAQLPSLAAPDAESGDRDGGRGHNGDDDDDDDDIEEAVEALNRALRNLRGLIGGDIDVLRGELADAKASILGGLRSLSNQHADLGTDIIAAIEHLEVLFEELNELLGILQAEVLAEIGLLGTQLDTLSENVLGAIELLSENVLGAIESLGDRLTSLAETLEVIGGTLSDLGDTLGNIVDTLGALGEQLSAMQDTLAGVADALDRVEGSLANIEDTISGFDTRLAGIEARLAETLVIRHVTNYGAAIEGGKAFSIGVSCTENYLVEALYAEVSVVISGSTINVAYNQIRAKGNFADAGISFWRMGSTTFDPTAGAQSVLPYQLLSQMNINHPVGIPAGGLFIIDGEVKSTGVDGVLNVGVVLVTSGTAACTAVVSV